eukprot:TRINITY_DN30782_c0_g1_i1.p4 TRINITY_DN30782_c0_g1~~TRINITY_DN30782_c0_g1_i1.p4  ORF type:complete len:109 (-),score=26.12 TRINITY_DN30782_c0_g1_i1:1812-2138(-)
MVKIILDQCKLLIKQALIQTQIAQNSGELASAVEELDWLPAILSGSGQTAAEKKQTQLSYYLAFQTNIAMMKRAIFNEACINGAKGNTKCRDWEKVGTLIQAVQLLYR